MAARDLTLRHRLAEFLAFQQGRAFAWGTSDCAMFAADWVAMLTGRDPAEAWRARYNTERGAARTISGAGGLMAMAGAMGWRPVPRAGLGDVGLIEPGPARMDRGLRFAVAGAGTWIMRAPSGVLVERRALWLARHVWRWPDA